MSRAMARVLTHEAGPKALSWAVFSALGIKSSYPYVLGKGWRAFDPVHCWEDAWGLIQEARISFVTLQDQAEEKRFGAVRLGSCGKVTIARGSTLLIAAVRCWLASKAGPVIEVPAGLAIDDDDAEFMNSIIDLGEVSEPAEAATAFA